MNNILIYYRRSLEEMIENFEVQIKLIEEDARLDGEDVFNRINKINGKIEAIKQAMAVLLALLDLQHLFPSEESQRGKETAVRIPERR